MAKKLSYKQVCAECGSYDVEYTGTTNNTSKWSCSSCKKPVKVKTKAVRVLR
jgi:transposase-like protein